MKAPLIRQCRGNLECRVAGTLETGDHTVFCGEIVAAHVNDDTGRRIYNMGDYVFKPLP